MSHVPYVCLACPAQFYSLKELIEHRGYHQEVMGRVKTARKDMPGADCNWVVFYIHKYDNLLVRNHDHLCELLYGKFCGHGWSVDKSRD